MNCTYSFKVCTLKVLYFICLKSKNSSGPFYLPSSHASDEPYNFDTRPNNSLAAAKLCSKDVHVRSHHSITHGYRYISQFCELYIYAI